MSTNLNDFSQSDPSKHWLLADIPLSAVVASLGTSALVQGTSCLLSDGNPDLAEFLRSMEPWADATLGVSAGVAAVKALAPFSSYVRAGMLGAAILLGSYVLPQKYEAFIDSRGGDKQTEMQLTETPKPAELYPTGFSSDGTSGARTPAPQAQSASRG